MTKNVGTLDRILRFIAAGVIAILLLTGMLTTGWLKIILLIFAIIFVFTGIIGWCGLYALLGISTVKKNNEVK
jgi:hypothetical protein